MLGGRVDHQIDDKFRIRIPNAFLSEFPKGEKLYFVEYAPGCISIMPESVKNRRIGSEEDFDPDDEEFMDAMRVIFASVMPVEQDAQGRIVIPKHYREIAGLKKDVVSVGFMDFVEVWDRDRYEVKRTSMTVKQANAAYYKKRRAALAAKAEESAPAQDE